ncbi:MAG: hypothetical protein V4857_16495 [Pseudomonadota bacterium]
MSVWYSLVNQTRREYIAFSHIPAATKRELIGNPVSAAIISWYLFEYGGDNIAFVSDTDGVWPFKDGSKRDLIKYRECTDEVVAALVGAEILRDDGREIFDEKEPDVFIRRLRCVWMEDSVQLGTQADCSETEQFKV